jgi:hypothetical protein
MPSYAGADQIEATCKVGWLGRSRRLLPFVSLYRQAILVLLPVLLNVLSAPQALSAHIHCSVQPWGVAVTQFSPTPGSPLATYPTNGLGAFVGLAPFPSAAANAGDDCGYEISDITTITVQFTSIGSVAWQSLRVGVAGFLSESTPFTPPTIPASFVSGQTYSITLPAHPDSGAQEFDALHPVLPFPRLGIEFSGPIGTFTIEQAVILAGGHHYYIPEPDSFALFCGVLLLFLACRRPASSF